MVNDHTVWYRPVDKFPSPAMSLNVLTVNTDTTVSVCGYALLRFNAIVHRLCTFDSVEGEGGAA